MRRARSYGQSEDKEKLNGEILKIDRNPCKMPGLCAKCSPWVTNVYTLVDFVCAPQVMDEFHDSLCC